VKFEFISHPEFVKEGMKLLFREGKTKVWKINIKYLFLHKTEGFPGTRSCCECIDLCTLFPANDKIVACPRKKEVVK